MTDDNSKLWRRFSVWQPKSQRLDQFLTQINCFISRSQSTKAIECELVLINEKKTKAAYKVNRTDLISWKTDFEPTLEIRPTEKNLEIIFEDEDLFIINKPQGLIVHPANSTKEITLVDILINRFPPLQNIGEPSRPGIVHRLDKGTSGVMVVAKSKFAYEHLVNQFKGHEVKKVYHAFVYGQPRLAKARLENFLQRSPSNRKKFSVHQTEGKLAITEYQTLSSYHGISFLEVLIKTGRTHQIRVHLSHLGHPVIGDPTYGGHKKRLKQIADLQLRTWLQKLTRPLLHANQLEFTHPRTQKKMSFKANEPADFIYLKEYFL